MWQAFLGLWNILYQPISTKLKLLVSGEESILLFQITSWKCATYCVAAAETIGFRNSFFLLKVGFESGGLGALERLTKSINSNNRFGRIQTQNFGYDFCAEDSVTDFLHFSLCFSSPNIKYSVLTCFEVEPLFDWPISLTLHHQVNFEWERVSLPFQCSDGIYFRHNTDCHVRRWIIFSAPQFIPDI
jgi:hypothetical protein